MPPRPAPPKPPSVLYVVWSPSIDVDGGVDYATNSLRRARMVAAERSMVEYQRGVDAEALRTAPVRILRYAPIPPKPRKRAAKRRAR